jgi:hypothetical protein
VGNGWLAVLARHSHLKDAKVILGHGRRIAVPVVEVADEVCSHGVWRPLAVHNITVCLDVEAILLVTLGMVSFAAIGYDEDILTLENFSRPPSVSLIFLIHCCALAKRLCSAPLKGSR